MNNKMFEDMIKGCYNYINLSVCIMVGDSLKRKA